MITSPRVALIALFALAGPVVTASAAPHTAAVKDYHGRPTLFVDEKAVTPDFYALTHAYGARWSWEEVAQRNIKNFADLGFRLFQLDLYLDDLWFKDAASLNLDKATRQVRGVLEVCPDARIVLRIHVNAPHWWNAAHRDECVQFADGPIDQREYGPPLNLEDGDVDRPLRASLASTRWRQESGEKLREFCQRLAATPEGDYVIGLHISGGIYGEWHNWGFISHDPDTSQPMTDYFRSWLKTKYRTDAALQQAWGSARFTLADATVPDLVERDTTSDGVFRDPQKERRVIDYYTAQHEVVAEDIEYFTGIAKHTWPRPLIVGVFYGYLHMTFDRQQAGGHLAIERILNCPTVDYLAAPQSYSGPTQQVGGSGNSRGVIESARLHGKLWLDEMDNGFLQKHSGGDSARSGTRFDPEYLPVLQRSALYPLMRGVGLWYYDFGIRESFGWWDSPGYLTEIRQEKALFDARLTKEFTSAADVLCVWDQESFYYVKSRRTPVSYNLIDQAFEEALHSGTTSDQIYVFDLDKVNLQQYRAVMFMNVYKLTAKQRAFIHDKVAQDGRTLIWNYLPGYTDGERNSLDFVQAVTGFTLSPLAVTNAPAVSLETGGVEYGFEGPVAPLAKADDAGGTVLARFKHSGEPAVVRKTFADHASVYSSLPLHDSNFFRRLFREAGCHVYNEANDFTYVNSGMVMVHSKVGGKRELVLRSGKRIAFDLPPFSTWLFDAESGERLLQ